MGRRTSDPLAHPERLTQSIYAYVAYRIGAGPDAEDVTSETFARALRYRKSYDGSKGTPVAWLIGIARRVLAERAGQDHETVAEVPETAAPGMLEDESVSRLTMQAAVATLSERDRELVALRYGADLTAAQIGEQLELSPNAVEVALHRALRRLRAGLEGEAAAPAGPAAFRPQRRPRPSTADGV
ncbi:MAG TPA: sigma-70 family RNA polymerase sigma factor [Gaiellales bacterium]|nr:sigma-70 family RNA polymerase sigma factor [Gaiellales bacterium]